MLTVTHCTRIHFQPIAEVYSLLYTSSDKLKCTRHFKDNFRCNKESPWVQYLGHESVFGDTPLRSVDTFLLY